MEVRIFGIGGLPEVKAGDDVGAMVLDAAERQATPIEPWDVVVIAQKIVSKAEGRLVSSSSKEETREVARREARRIVRDNPHHLIIETKHGFVCANAGIDASNVADGYICLLPRDPDASAQRIRSTIETRIGGHAAVIVSDTFGRPWRKGQTNVAIGSSGITALRDYVGEFDPAGRPLLVTRLAHIDELAGAAELMMGKLDRVPAAVVRGYTYKPSDESGATDLVRAVEDDLFR